MKKKKIKNPFKLMERGSWGETHPATRVEKSKKKYNRKNKNWKKDI